MFARSMEELEVVFPTREEAALATARAIAREVVGGIETPYDGANRIWLRVSLEFEDLKQLLIFGGLVSTIDDDPDHRADYEQRIVAECKKLLEE